MTHDLRRSLRPLILALIPGRQKELNKLKDMRAKLSNELMDVINSFGPNLYPDFDQAKLVFMINVAASIVRYSGENTDSLRETAPLHTATPTEEERPRYSRGFAHSSYG